MVDYAKQLGPVKPGVRDAALEVCACAEALGRPLKQLWGYNPASKPEHSAGVAVDFMVYNDRGLGDKLADYLWTNRARLNVRWIIWRQRIRSTTPGKGNAWRPMADRGNTTQNHFDHLHVCFTGEPVRDTVGLMPANIKGAPDWYVHSTRVSLEGLIEASKRPEEQTQYRVNVCRLEVALARVGMLDGPTWSGKYNARIKAAVAAFQRKCGWTGADADGIVGPETIRRLDLRTV